MSLGGLAKGLVYGACDGFAAALPAYAIAAHLQQARLHAKRLRPVRSFVAGIAYTLGALSLMVILGEFTWVLLGYAPLAPALFALLAIRLGPPRSA
jgi:hypothetical protein